MPTTAPVPSSSGRPSARPGPHVVEQQVGVGADHLLVERGDVAVAGVQLADVARRAADLLEGLLTGSVSGDADVAAGRDGERARVEGDLVELVVVELGVTTVGAR